MKEIHEKIIEESKDMSDDTRGYVHNILMDCYE